MLLAEIRALIPANKKVKYSTLCTILSESNDLFASGDANREDLIALFAEAKGLRDEHDNNLLHIAAFFPGYDDLYPLLLEAGLDVTAITAREYTPLETAFTKKHVKITRLILAEIEKQKDSSGKLPNPGNNRSCLFARLLPTKSEFLRAVMSGNVAKVEVLLAIGDRALSNCTERQIIKQGRGKWRKVYHHAGKYNFYDCHEDDTWLDLSPLLYVILRSCFGTLQYQLTRFAGRNNHCVDNLEILEILLKHGVDLFQKLSYQEGGFSRLDFNPNDGGLDPNTKATIKYDIIPIIIAIKSADPKICKILLEHADLEKIVDGKSLREHVAASDRLVIRNFLETPALALGLK